MKPIETNWRARAPSREGNESEHASFARRLREARDERRITQRSLAQAIGMSPSWIAKLEAGRQRPSFDTLHTLADALGVTADRLLNGDPEDNAGKG